MMVRCVIEERYIETQREICLRTNRQKKNVKFRQRPKKIFVDGKVMRIYRLGLPSVPKFRNFF